MTKRTTKLTASIIILLIGIAIYFIFSPEDSKYFPQCPFHYFTGLDCPGCGSQRAIHSLLHLEIKKAFLYNPLLVVAIPYIIMGIYMEYFGGKEKYPTIRKRLMGRNAIFIIFFIIVIFWIVRNIIKFV
ncbi:MAG: DUF2752 domain-containing protein [Dysgonomonas sp.]